MFNNNNPNLTVLKTGYMNSNNNNNSMNQENNFQTFNNNNNNNNNNNLHTNMQPFNQAGTRVKASNKKEGLLNNIKLLEGKLEALKKKQSITKRDKPLPESSLNNGKELYKQVPIFKEAFFEIYYQKLEQKYQKIDSKEYEKVIQLYEKNQQLKNGNWVENELINSLNKCYEIKLEIFKVEDSVQYGYKLGGEKKEEVEEEGDEISRKAKELLRKRMQQLNLNNENETQGINEEAKQRIKEYEIELEIKKEEEINRIKAIQQEKEEIQSKMETIKRNLIPENFMKEKIKFNNFKVKMNLYKSFEASKNVYFKSFLKDLIRLSENINIKDVELLAIPEKKTKDTKVEDISVNSDNIADRNTINNIGNVRSNELFSNGNISKSIASKQPEKEIDQNIIIKEKEIAKEVEKPRVEVIEPKAEVIEPKVEIKEDPKERIIEKESKLEEVKSNNPFLNKQSHNPFFNQLNNINNNKEERVKQDDVLESKDNKEELQEKSIVEEISNKDTNKNNEEVIGLKEEEQGEQEQNILYKAIASYDYSVEDSEFEFQCNDYLNVLEENEEWLLGYLINNPSLMDWFPKSYVEVVNEDGEIEYKQQNNLFNDADQINNYEDSHEDNAFDNYANTDNVFDNSIKDNNIFNTKQYNEDTIIETEEINKDIENNEIAEETIFNNENIEERSKYKLLFEYSNENEEDEDNTVFEPDSIFIVIEKEDPDWWLCHSIDNEEKLIYLPASYLEFYENL
ncbi:hypothetical protein K502DRAFT_16853 [Neoconidiobolus thromboides FSU 785]|nr:hypothetical protein K502DRAFT_16853 [Neoconidiobolus thromboides FSU 785]